MEERTKEWGKNRTKKGIEREDERGEGGRGIWKEGRREQEEIRIGKEEDENVNSLSKRRFLSLIFFSFLYSHHLMFYTSGQCKETWQQHKVQSGIYFFITFFLPSRIVKRGMEPAQSFVKNNFISFYSLSGRDSEKRHGTSVEFCQ